MAERDRQGEESVAGRVPVGTLERGLALLSALGEGEEGLTLTELARRVGLPKPTALRILKTLEEQGFAARSGRSYRVGYQCFRLGNLYAFDDHLQRRALPVMEDVMEEVAEVVQLGVLREDEVLYLERVEPRRSIALVLSRPGSTRPAYCTALGKAMLAQLGKGELEDYLRRTKLAACTGRTITDPERLVAELAETRERGYAEDDGEIDEEIGCVAAPIFDASGCAVAAMSVSAPRFRMSGEGKRRAAAAIRKAAARLSAS